MKNDIQKRYVFNQKLAQEEIDANKEKDILIKFIRVFTPVYYIDLFGTGHYSKIDNSDDPFQSSIIVKYKYLKNNNSFYDWFYIFEKYSSFEKEGNNILYEGTPSSYMDSNGNIYFPPQGNILYLNKETGTDFFEDLMIEVVNKDIEFKKKYMWI